MSDTIARRPLPKRPQNGLLAWQATIGYLSSAYSPDALLTIRVYPLEDGSIAWGSIAAWAQSREEVASRPSLPDALRGLWDEVHRSHHALFDTPEAVIRRPALYNDDQWIDGDTQQVLERVIQVTAAVYGRDWLLVLVYQPVESQDLRWQARLLALDGKVQASGRGATLGDSCRDLYRNAAHHYVTHSGKRLEDI